MLFTVAFAIGFIGFGGLIEAFDPDPGKHSDVFAGVFGSIFIVVALWTCWYAALIKDPGDAVAVAQARLDARRRALEILRSNPTLATELSIGRPDELRTFDDGGLIDVNGVPLRVLSSLPGLDKPLAERIVNERGGIGGFDSCDDLETLLDVPPRQLHEIRDRLVFRKYQSM